MAKRITLDTFSKGIVSHYGKDVLSRAEIKSYASYKGVGVPGGWNDNVVGRNQYKFSAVDVARASRTKIDYTKLGNDTSTDEIFEDLEMLMDVVTKKKINSLIVTGNAGIGKTHTVTNSLNKKGMVKDQDYIVLKSKISPLGLYMTLFLHHDKVIVFDDLDDLFTNDDCAAILKAALDSYDVREISWSSKKMVNVVGMKGDSRRTVESEARAALMNGETDVALPNRFTFKGQIVFISNLSADKFDKAVQSRSVCIDLTLNDTQVFSRMKSIVHKLTNARIAEKALTSIIEKYNEGSLAMPNMRTVLNYANVMSAGVKNADRLSKYC